MLKYVSLIILYILVVSSFLSIIIYEETGNEVGIPIGNLYEGITIDFTGNLKLKDIVGNTHGTFGWELINNTLVYKDGNLISNFEPLMFKGITEDENRDVNVKININNKDNSNFILFVTRNNKNLIPYSQDLSSYEIEYINNKLTMYYPYVHTTVFTAFREEVFTQNIDLTGKHTIAYTISNKQKTFTLKIDEQLIGVYPIKLDDKYDYYLGIAIREQGEFVIESIEATIIIPNVDDTSFLRIIGSLLLWNVDVKYMPLALNILLIKFPLMILTIAVAFYIRGI